MNAKKCLQTGPRGRKEWSPTGTELFFGSTGCEWRKFCLVVSCVAKVFRTDRASMTRVCRKALNSIVRARRNAQLDWRTAGTWAIMCVVSHLTGAPPSSTLQKSQKISPSFPAGWVVSSCEPDGRFVWMSGESLDMNWMNSV